MKLLIISSNTNRASFRQRIEVYLDILQANGIHCEVAKLPSGLLARRKLFKKAAGYDGVFLHKKKLNLLDAIWLRRYSRKIIYDFDDAIMYSDKTPQRDSLSHLWSFRRTVKLDDMVVAGNSYLAEHARKYNPRVEVLPTGLDIKAYTVESQPENDGKIRLVWIGSHSTINYLAEIKPALEEIGSRFDNVILRIVCDEFFDLQNIPVEKRRWSLETEAADLVASDIGLAPLPDNRFTRGKCGFKILQYAAASLPVVASPVGTNPYYVRDGATGFLAASIQEWIDRIAQLVKDPLLRKKMGHEGIAQAQKFDTSIIGKQLTRLISECLRGAAD